ncbi:hypothetical protein [Halomonas sp. NO4]|uniref:hypothetical protein n=1 Tax=Halomonas sp. NO4 TaxID=2484813 RepID=UPI0013D5DCCF|nr:hypothetical protein [Halomonas sp. NO4]
MSQQAPVPEEGDFPEQFLYARKGPWPQPSPSYPLQCADEVLHIPPMEDLLFQQTIGKRYLEAQLQFKPVAARMAARQLDSWHGVDDARFNEMMLETLFTRFYRPLEERDREPCPVGLPFDEGRWWKYDFSAMHLIDPIPGTHVAATKVFIQQPDSQAPSVRCIQLGHDEGQAGVWIQPEDSAWDIAKLYALQGASYHILFVVHPAIHFPMDAVNAITKTAIPVAHPLFQLFSPHSTYALPLDHAVLESAESVVANNAQGTRFDPLTANGFNVKQLFGAGYRGLPASRYGNAYPAFDYMRPQLETPGRYVAWLKGYFDNAFLPFTRRVAEHILASPEQSRYVANWARYCHAHVLGFPDARESLEPEILAHAMAIYIWNNSVVHGGDHENFATAITHRDPETGYRSAVNKCLRIRRAPPRDCEAPPVKPGEVFTGDDLARAELAQEMFFRTWAIPPNLLETQYAFLDSGLQAAADRFHDDLRQVSADIDKGRYGGVQFQPLQAESPDQYAHTIPASIQY